MSTSETEAPLSAAQLEALANSFFQGTGSAPALSVARPAIPGLPSLGLPGPAEGASLPSSPVAPAPSPSNLKSLLPYVPEVPGIQSLHLPGLEGLSLGSRDFSALGFASSEDLAPPRVKSSRPLAGPGAPPAEAQFPRAIPGDLEAGSGATSEPPELALGTSKAPTGSFYFLEAQNPFRSQEPKAPQIAARPASTPLDILRIRQDFPILSERIHGKPLVWLDNAATTQKPRQVIERLKHFYEHENSNVHRAAHSLAARATDAYEEARERVRGFLGAASRDEIVFVRGATEAINLVAKSWGKANLEEGDEILLSQLEHHANIVPWQQIAAERGAKIKVIPVDDDGQILLAEAARLLGPRTKILSVTQVSNALGTIVPVRALIALAHAAGAKVLVDGAQAVSHLRVNVLALDVDFYVFSGHKLFAPTGIGVLYGKKELLREMPPWQGGGNMIQDVTWEETAYRDTPARFEAGTGNIADAVGLGAAIEYLESLGFEGLGAYEQALLRYASEHLKRIPGLRLIGNAKEKASVLSFVLEGYTSEQLGRLLDEEGIAVRGGHHCAQPILRRFGLESTVRASLAFYNHCGDVDALVLALQKAASRPRPRL